MGIPNHTCTPYCDGERYCVLPGTHTLTVFTYSHTEADTIAVMSTYFSDVEFVHARREADARPRGQMYHADTGAEGFLDPGHMAWLITIREREEKRAA